MVRNLDFENNDSAGIYMISSKKCNKFYIGSTINLKSRHYQHCADYKYGYSSKSILELLHNDSFNNLIFSVVEVCTNLKNLKTMEQFYINFFADKLVNVNKVAARKSQYEK
jgi:group I intron endonuclease